MPALGRIWWGRPDFGQWDGCKLFVILSVHKVLSLVDDRWMEGWMLRSSYDNYGFLYDNRSFDINKNIVISHLLPLPVLSYSLVIYRAPFPSNPHFQGAISFTCFSSAITALVTRGQRKRLP